MLGGTWALANCSPTKNSKCASWVESNSGRRCSLVMPEGPPAEPRLDDRNVRKKRSSSTSNSGTKLRKSSGIGSHATLGRLTGFRNSCRAASLPGAKSAPSRAWLKTTPQPEREPTDSRHVSPPHQLPFYGVGKSASKRLRKHLAKRTAPCQYSLCGAYFVPHERHVSHTQKPHCEIPIISKKRLTLLLETDGAAWEDRTHPTLPASIVDQKKFGEMCVCVGSNTTFGEWSDFLEKKRTSEVFFFRTKLKISCSQQLLKGRGHTQPAHKHA